MNRRGQRAKRLIGANVRSRFLAANVLLACRESEHKSATAFGVGRLSRQTPGHLAHKFVFRCDGRPEFRFANQLWRPICRRDRIERQICAPDARASGGTNNRHRRPSRIRTHSRDTRAAHSPRESDFEHLHQSGALRAGRDGSSDLAGKRRLARDGGTNLAKAQFALAELTKIPGVHRTFSGPFFNEFTIELPRSARIVNGYLLREKIVGPLPLGQNYPELTKMLWFASRKQPAAKISNGSPQEFARFGASAVVRAAVEKRIKTEKCRSESKRLRATRIRTKD